MDMGTSLITAEKFQEIGRQKDLNKQCAQLLAKMIFFGHLTSEGLPNQVTVSLMATKLPVFMFEITKISSKIRPNLFEFSRAFINSDICKF